MEILLPDILKPNSVEVFDFGNTEIKIPKTQIKFQKWGGHPFSNTYGGKPFIHYNNSPLFAELTIVKLFQSSNWQARWIATYGASKLTPFHFSNWTDVKLKEQKTDPIIDKNVLEILKGIATLNNNNYSGCWDVLAWNIDSLVFAESKRSKKDKIRSTQNNWLTAGLSYGLKPENFLVVEWDFK